MTRLRHYAAALALVAALAGCTSDPEPAAAPTTQPAPTSAAPSPTPGPDGKRGCAAAAKLAGKDPEAYRDAGALAAESTVPAIRQAGLDLVNAANDAVAEPGVEADVALDRAAVAVTQACADEFGDGPWS